MPSRFNSTKRFVGIASRALCGLLMATACGGSARLSVADGTGATPQLPAARTSIIPTINVVTARRWKSEGLPVAGTGSRVNAFARGLEHPRWLSVLLNGDVLMAETNAPPKVSHGFHAWAFNRLQTRAGDAVPSPDRIALRRDLDGDGIAETRSTLLLGVHSPFGMVIDHSGALLQADDVGNTVWRVIGAPMRP